MRIPLGKYGSQVVTLICGGLLYTALTHATEQQLYRRTPGVRVPVKTEWIAELTSSDPERRLEAVQRLREIDADPKQAIPPLVHLLSDPNEALRDAAAEALRFMGPDVVPALRDVIRREGLTAGRHDPGVRTQRIASSILGSISALSGHVLDDALQVASEACVERRLHEVVRHDACQSLARLGASQEPARLKAIAVLVHVFQELDVEYLRSDLIFAFETLGPDAAIIQALEQALDDDNAFIRRYAAWALGRFGPAARESLAALTHASLTDKDLEVRASAALAIQQITPTNSLGEDHR